uniref:Uncharacterized protein n=1 Tax=Oncorhynchus tshawytscha TaxID=74940 RepID=A0A8C8K5M5_ONCTS
MEWRDESSISCDAAFLEAQALNCSMEWREQSSISCDAAFMEAQIWVEGVTNHFFWILLCDLINRIKPGIIKRVNRLSTPIAGLDNVIVFLRLKEAQLFRSGDLQDTSTKVNVKKTTTVLITIYWLGRKAQCEPFYNGPNLRLKAFEGLLDIAALSKVNK